MLFYFNKQAKFIQKSSEITKNLLGIFFYVTL